MSEIIKIVTCPELGWDCVVACFSYQVPDADIMLEYPEGDYVISEVPLQHVVTPR